MIRRSIDVVDWYAPIRENILAVQRIFDDELASEHPFVNDLCERVRSYRGKMLRPSLLLLCGQAAGDLTPGHNTLAAVVEMVHMATLVHDDVLDEADERRSQPAVWSTHGNTTAVLLGDYLISHAYHLCSSLDSQHASLRIAATTNVVCEGEMLQNRHCGNASLTEAEYFEIIDRKTGALTATSCELGAFQSDADIDVVQSLRRYGMYTGRAFQIVDDVLDIQGDAARVGKTLGVDLAMGKATLPIIHCLRHASPDTVSVLRAMITGERPCDGDWLRDTVVETDSVAYALSLASRYVDQAVVELDCLTPSDAKASLIAMAEFIVQRNY